MLFEGIPRPLPINKSQGNRESFVCEGDDVAREGCVVSSSRSVEDTEDFKRAVESFDQMFEGEEGSGHQSPDLRRRSRDPSLPLASPNLNWKRIKTSRSFEEEESLQRHEVRGDKLVQEREQHSSHVEHLQQEEYHEHHHQEGIFKTEIHEQKSKKNHQSKKTVDKTQCDDVRSPKNDVSFQQPIEFRLE